MSKSANAFLPGAKLSFGAKASEELSTRVLLLNLTVVILPFLGFAAIVVTLWGRGFH